MTVHDHLQQRVRSLWSQLYADRDTRKLEAFLIELADARGHASAPLEAQWYKDVVVYSLYVDLFDRDFRGLTNRLDYLQELGATCLWLLPILDSPMKDAGFDIRDYRRIRADLVGGDDDAAQQSFSRFLDQAHARGIRVIFDVALNHSSDQCRWFQEARKGPENPHRNYYIWSDTERRYAEARIIFKGMMHSNWQKLHDEKQGDIYYFHRFFESQPDLNYRNPDVLLDMCRVLLFWVDQGVDGFRADAVPYLWKEEGTICENLPETHAIVKFFRAVLDAVRPGTILLAEACQPPVEVVNYFGDGDECQAAYHFPLMPRIYLALARERAKPIRDTLSVEFTPHIPAGCQWFSFLRCHDELTLEMVSPDERKAIYSAYCHQPAWDFRQGEGIAARLAELFRFDEASIRLAFSLTFTLLGTPVIFYGDELAKPNDEQYQREQETHTGYSDARYRVRGPLNWDQVLETAHDPTQLGGRIFAAVREMLGIRAQHKAFGRGSLRFFDVANDHVLAYVREHQGEVVLLAQNLSAEPQRAVLPEEARATAWRGIYGGCSIDPAGNLTLPAKNFGWFVS